MGTRADFYVGTAEQSPEDIDNPDFTWLGSIGWDGYPDGVPDSLLEVSNVEEYLEELDKFFTSIDHATKPADGWPWPWNDSNTTDYTYAFFGGKLWATNGGPWFDPTEDKPEEEECSRVVNQVFPDMSDKKNVTLGQRSGLIVVRI